MPDSFLEEVGYEIMHRVEGNDDYVVIDGDFYNFSDGKKVEVGDAAYFQTNFFEPGVDEKGKDAVYELISVQGGACGESDLVGIIVAEKYF